RARRGRRDDYPGLHLLLVMHKDRRPASRRARRPPPFFVTSDRARRREEGVRPPRISLHRRVGCIGSGGRGCTQPYRARLGRAQTAVTTTSVRPIIEPDRSGRPGASDAAQPYVKSGCRTGATPPALLGSEPDKSSSMSGVPSPSLSTLSSNIRLSAASSDGM